MQRQAAVAAWSLALPLLLVISVAEAHNITKLLAKHPEFSTFNHYLSATNLAQEINHRATITVCVVNNAAFSGLLAKHPSIYSIKNILSFHVLLDYFDAKKLHQIARGTALAATLFQASGTATGTSGFVNITDLRGGKIGLSPEENDGKIDTYFVKSVEQIPYYISVIQISKTLPWEIAEAPTSGPSERNMTAVMSAHGCKVFADTLLASGALNTFSDNAIGGLTVFCPADEVFKAFLPTYRNFTAAGKNSLLEFHGIPIYMSISMLKSNNGPMNTLATDGDNKFDFTVQNEGDDVTLQTKIATVKITGTLLDEQPVAIYTVDKVLKPTELFTGEAPAPATKAKEGVKPHQAVKGHKEVSSPAPADSPDDDDPADLTTDDHKNGCRFEGLNLGLEAACLLAWLFICTRTKLRSNGGYDEADRRRKSTLPTMVNLLHHRVAGCALSLLSTYNLSSSTPLSSFSAMDVGFLTFLFHLLPSL